MVNYFEKLKKETLRVVVIEICYALESKCLDEETEIKALKLFINALHELTNRG